MFFVWSRSCFMFGWLFSSISKFLHDIRQSHWLQFGSFFSLAQIRIVQTGLPPPFKHPWHKETFWSEASPFMNSLKSKSFGAHFSNWFLLTASSYLLVSSTTEPLPAGQLPHHMPQKPIWFFTLSKGLMYVQSAPEIILNNQRIKRCRRRWASWINHRWIWFVHRISIKKKKNNYVL